MEKKKYNVVFAMSYEVKAKDENEARNKAEEQFSQFLEEENKAGDFFCNTNEVEL